MRKIREYLYSLMTDRKKGFIAAALKGILYAVSFFYGLSIGAIRPVRIFASKGVPCRVISIGNLTLGGTGKTPTACMLAKLLKSQGRNPAVLIRGYGEDEWRMLESMLGGIPVIVGRDRISSGREAIEKYNADTVILDDGFQHWRIKRDLDIVLIDSTNPFGNRRLFPRGVLREAIGDLRRADIAMLTKTDMDSGGLQDLKDELRDIAPDMPVLESVHDPVRFSNLADKKELDLGCIKGVNVCCLSSIVNTGYFEYTLSKRLGANIILRLHYPDHYNYQEKDLEYILNECKKRNIDAVVTTEKDAVKLNAIRNTPFDFAQGRQYALRLGSHALTTSRSGQAIRILVLCVELKVTNGEEILRERLHSLYSG